MKKLYYLLVAFLIDTHPLSVHAQKMHSGFLGGSHFTDTKLVFEKVQSQTITLVQKRCLVQACSKIAVQDLTWLFGERFTVLSIVESFQIINCSAPAKLTIFDLYQISSCWVS